VSLIGLVLWPIIIAVIGYVLWDYNEDVKAELRRQGKLKDDDSE